MTLRVFTSRISYRGPGRFDVTRSGASRAMHFGNEVHGGPFAPSWGLLTPALEARRAGDGRWWPLYIEAYVAEMRASYRADRAAWDRLLARHRVVLCCYCSDPEQCHRVLLGRDILPKLGAVYVGEVLREAA